MSQIPKFVKLKSRTGEAQSWARKPGKKHVPQVRWNM